VTVDKPEVGESAMVRLDGVIKINILKNKSLSSPSSMPETKERLIADEHPTQPNQSADHGEAIFEGSGRSPPLGARI
jgi:hypothetical protein